MTLFKNWWGRLLFQDRGVLPTAKLLVILAIIGFILTVLAINHFLIHHVLIMTAILISISLIDLLLSPKRSLLEAHRSIPEEFERQKNHTITVTIQNNSNRPCMLRFVDQIPTSFQTIFPYNQMIKAQRMTEINYHVFPLERGEYMINKLYIRYKSMLGLWEKQKTVTIRQVAHVIPNLEETNRYLASAQRYLLHEGIKIRKQKTGMGEFSKVRSYVVGDDPRKINWHQSAKLQEVMTNEYEPEHGKHITLLIDCGRMMGVELDKGNRLEKVLEATIATAAAALKNGDYVSVVAFSSKIHTYVAPAKGLEHLQVILRAVYALQVDASESNYTNVLHYVQLKQKKRSLLLLFSDVDTFVYEETILHSLQQIRKKHLFIIIGIEDEQLQAKRNIYPLTVRIAMEKTIAQKQLQFKAKQIK
ncbi:DUF58 domain-containing protein [Paraliobacillus sp. JSM ZJ581]|uniref:DUF58 domain-containing protein n=1 Tax=Paraliobacillus sp. JSM ZJ581 TaxID=3342118 RepID=UPI0035A97F37